MWIEVEDSFLDITTFRSFRSKGLFAISGAECLHLCKIKPENFQKFLKTENNLEHVPVKSMSNLIIDVCLTDKKNTYRLIENHDEIGEFKNNSDTAKDLEITKPIKEVSEYETRYEFMALRNIFPRNKQVCKIHFVLNKSSAAKIEISEGSLLKTESILR
jgi:hypothetical protein